MSVLVSIKKCESYSRMNLYSAVHDVIEMAGGLKNIVKQGDKVLLKPNLLSVSPPESAINTHPAVVQSVIKYLKELKALPYVAEGSGFVASTEDALEKSGILEVCREENIEVHSFTKKGFAEVAVQGHEILIRFTLLRMYWMLMLLYHFPN
jgi:uncharacterized protein (DUF362 family)